MVMANDPVAAQYESWVYPKPIVDMAAAIAGRGYFDASDPAVLRRKFWPRKVEPDDLDILIAGCGSNQAAYFAFTNPGCRVVGIDVSDASLAHERYLQEKHDLRNLELHQLNLEEASSLGRSFDLIVSSGVLHHLPDPDAGLRGLRDVLEPHGVISLMLYGHYPRVGVHMLQEAFRVLGLGQDAAGIAMVKHTQDVALPRWHHAVSYANTDPDRGFDAGVVDTYLHARERAYTVPDILRLVSNTGMKLQGWLDNLDYTIALRIPNPDDPLRRLVETLPIAEQWQVVELIGQALARHFPLVCHPDRPDADYALDFTGDAWLDYVPGPRPRMDIVEGQPAESSEGAPAPAMSLKRYRHRVGLDPFEAALFKRVDGKRSIIEIIDDETLDGENALQDLQRARGFFRRMAHLDYLLYEIP